MTGYNKPVTMTAKFIKKTQTPSIVNGVSRTTGIHVTRPTISPRKKLKKGPRLKTAFEWPKAAVIIGCDPDRGSLSLNVVKQERRD